MSLLFRYVFFQSCPVAAVDLGRGRGAVPADGTGGARGHLCGGGHRLVGGGAVLRRPPAVHHRPDSPRRLSAGLGDHIVPYGPQSRNHRASGRGRVARFGGLCPGAVRFVLGRGSTGLFPVFGRVGRCVRRRIWREQVRKRTAEMRVLDNVWFTDKAWIVSLDTLRQDGEGTGFVAYRLSDDGLRFVSIVRGPSFHADPGAWLVRDAVRISP